jgi:two-component system response regulator YesN
MYRCHCGLTEAICPVIINPETSGYLMFGQVLNSSPSEDEENLTVKEIAFILGFYDPNYFSRILRKAVGLSPVEYRRK